MAYIQGQALDMNGVYNALISACTSNGWSSGNDAEGKAVIYKDDCFVRVTVDNTNNKLELLGRTTMNGGGLANAPAIVQIKKVCNEAISFPLNYYAFISNYEVYFVINYGDIYQWCAFGQSQQPGLPEGATGNWVAATTYPNAHDASVVVMGIADGLNKRYDYYQYYYFCPGLFWVTKLELDTPANWFFHSNYNPAIPWAWDYNNPAYAPLGIIPYTELINAQPNAFSGEAVLLPIRLYLKYLESKIIQVMELEHARYCRIDNLTPKQVISLGDDNWMVFPWYKKNSAVRNGGNGVNHSGTFGWAIRK